MAVQMNDKGRLRWVVVLTAVGSFMAALDTLVVASALTTIKRDLGASLTDLEWTVNAYNLSFAVLLVPAAVLGDRLGRARTYAGGLVLFALASAGCALAGSVGALVAMRVAAGRRRRRAADPGHGPAHLGVPARDAAARRSACSARSPGSRSRAARWSAARSSTGWPGSGSSGSTCRSACWRRRWCCG